MSFKKALTLTQQNPSIIKTLHIIKLLDGKEEIQMPKAPTKQELQQLAQSAGIGVSATNEDKSNLQQLAKSQEEIIARETNKNFAHLALPGILTEGHRSQTSPLSLSKSTLNKIAITLDSNIGMELKKCVKNVKGNDAKPTGPTPTNSGS
jgi:hypothetical protein